MDADQKDTLAMTRNSSAIACGRRLRVGREVAELTQKQLAEATGKTKASISNAENGLSFPGRDAQLHLHRNYGIDFNFLVVGEYVQLPSPLQDLLFERLSLLASELDQERNSD